MEKQSENRIYNPELIRSLIKVMGASTTIFLLLILLASSMYFSSTGDLYDGEITLHANAGGHVILEGSSSVETSRHGHTDAELLYRYAENLLRRIPNGINSYVHLYTGSEDGVASVTDGLYHVHIGEPINPLTIYRMRQAIPSVDSPNFFMDINIRSEVSITQETREGILRVIQARYPNVNSIGSSVIASTNIHYTAYATDVDGDGLFDLQFDIEFTFERTDGRSGHNHLTITFNRGESPLLIVRDINGEDRGPIELNFAVAEDLETIFPQIFFTGFPSEFSDASRSA